MSVYTCISVGSDGVIRYWSLQNGNLLGSFNSETEVVQSIAYSDSLLGKPSLLVADENLIHVYTNYLWKINDFLLQDYNKWNVRMMKFK